MRGTLADLARRWELSRARVAQMSVEERFPMPVVSGATKRGALYDFDECDRWREWRMLRPRNPGRPRKPRPKIMPEHERRIVRWRQESGGEVSYRAIAHVLRMEFGIEGVTEEHVRVIARQAGCASKPHGSSYHGGERAARYAKREARVDA